MQLNGNGDRDQGRSWLRSPSLSGAWGLRVWGAFALLGVLLGSAWTLPEIFPGQIHGGLTLLAAYVLVAGGAVCWCRVRSSPRSDGSLRRLLLPGLLLFGAPPVLLAAAGRGLVTETQVAVMALSPFTVLLMVLVQEGGDAAYRLMVPALLPFAGAMLLFPVSAPEGVRGLVSLTLAVLAMLALSYGTVLVRERLSGWSMAVAAPWLLVPSAVALAMLQAATEGWRVAGWLSVRQSLPLLLVEVLEIVLLLTLLRSMLAIEIALRLVLAPLVTVAEGAVLLHLLPTARMWVGAVLMLVGAVLLLRREAPVTLSLR